jgi:radical SAM-linked protein
VGPAALLAHLDLVRELPRIFRRAGARMVYTSGFHPKPSLSFGPALALGVPSLDEYLDLRLAEPQDEAALAALCAALREAAPTGLRVVGAVPLAAGEPAVARVAVAARYLLLLPRSAGSPEELMRRCAEALARPQALVRRKVKGEERIADVRPSIVEAALASEAERQCLRKLDWPETLPTFRVDVALNVGPPARPSELCGVLFGEPAGAGAESPSSGGVTSRGANGAESAIAHRVLRLALLAGAPGAFGPILPCAGGAAPI